MGGGGNAVDGSVEYDVAGVDGASTATDDCGNDFDGARVTVVNTVIMTMQSNSTSK